MTTRARVELVFDMDVTVVCSTPTYAMRMAQEAEKLGLKLSDGPVKRLILSGEPAGSIPATKKLIERQWGAIAGDTAGMTEIGTIMIFECDHQPGGTHIIEDQLIEEVINPETEEPVPYGERGERVVTSFGRGFMPLLRYRSGDLVVKVPAATCSCGRTWDIYDGGILGRVDDMKLVRGTNVYPRAIEEIVRELEDIDEFQIHLYTADDIRDEIEVLVEMPDCENREEKDGILQQLAIKLREAHEGLRIGVKEVPPGSLPKFELKAKRLKDDRIVIGGSGERRER
jgi:phenylacetate-CoA ligase